LILALRLILTLRPLILTLRLILALGLHLRRRLIRSLHLRRRLILPRHLCLLSLVTPGVVLRAGSARTGYRTSGPLTLLFCPIVASIAAAPAPLTLGRKRGSRRKNTK
jgi:hypothetical protein